MTWLYCVLCIQEFPVNCNGNYLLLLNAPFLRFLFVMYLMGISKYLRKASHNWGGKTDTESQLAPTPEVRSSDIDYSSTYINTPFRTKVQWNSDYFKPPSVHLWIIIHPQYNSNNSHGKKNETSLILYRNILMNDGRYGGS